MSVLCEIITIGDEILQGRTVNGNAAFLGKELTRLGVAIRWSSTVSDKYDEITAALERALARALRRDRGDRDEPLEVVAVARRAIRRLTEPNQLLEVPAAATTFVVVYRHGTIIPLDCAQGETDAALCAILAQNERSFR